MSRPKREANAPKVFKKDSLGIFGEPKEKEHLRVALSLYNKGYDVSYISRALGLTGTQVATMLRKSGLKDVAV